MTLFDSGDGAYFAWLDKNPAGFVLNLRRNKRDPGYVVLHRATCRTIGDRRQLPGAYTEGAYRKVCALDVTELRAVARREGRADGSFSKICGLCRPYAR